MSADDAKQLQIRLVSAKPEFSVPTTTLSVPATTDEEGLQKLVVKLLEEGDDGDEKDFAGVKFHFTFMDDFVRGPLDAFLAAKEVSTTETVFEINYFDSNPPPEPDNDVNHDDWVAGVAACKAGYILTACYDNTVSVFAREGGRKLLTIPGHAGPVRDVVWISVDAAGRWATFASCSHDQVINLYHWDIASNSVENVNACKGHERSVDCIAVSPNGRHLASGSFDTNLKIWGAKLQQQGEAAAESAEAAENTKKAKTSSSVTRTPITTLAGHKEGISGVAFTEQEGEVCTASWDHTIRIWDFEMGGMKTELVGNKSFFGLAYSPLNRTVIAASADRTIRLYDPRSKEGVIVKSQFTSHEGWVTCVDWCRERAELFLSGGHDNLVKMWDSRSCKTPLYDLRGHDDRVLCCDWGDTAAVVSGGADDTLKVFRSNC